MTTYGITGWGRRVRRWGRVVVELGHNVVNTGRDLPVVIIPEIFDRGLPPASSPLQPADPLPANAEYEGK